MDEPLAGVFKKFTCPFKAPVNMCSSLVSMFNCPVSMFNSPMNMCSNSMSMFKRS